MPANSDHATDRYASQNADDAAQSGTRCGLAVLGRQVTGKLHLAHLPREFVSDYFTLRQKMPSHVSRDKILTT